MAAGATGSTGGALSLGGAGGRARGRLLYATARPRWGAELGVVLAGVGLICLSGLAWAQNPVSPQPVAPSSSARPAGSSASPGRRVADRYVIAKDDILDVLVEGVGELSREYRVGMDGMITLPMLTRPVMAAGLTIEQLSKAIAKELLDAGLLTDPQVIITMKSSPWNTVVLSGAAKKPGLYPVYGHMTMLELLTLAEGLTDDAGNTATVTRGQNAPDGPELTASQAVDNANGTSSRTVKVQVWKLWHDGDASLDVDLYPGDRVLVKRAGIVYIVGAVSRPGGYVLNDEEPMTLLTAIAVSLGFLPTAKTSKTMLIRKNPSVPGGREQFQVDLKKVLTLHAPDQQLFANDILYVPESGGKRTVNSLSTGLINTAVYAGVWRVAY